MSKKSLLCIGSAALSVAGLAGYMQYRTSEPPAPRGPVPPMVEGRMYASGVAARPRLHSGHAVVRGGIHNLPQLAAAMSNPEIAANFAGIDIGAMHPVVLDHSVIAWVSYYVDGAGLFWTVNPVLLRRGEVVLTDGSNYVRAQCGNRIAFAPGARVAPAYEEIPATLETPLSVTEHTAPPVTRNYPPSSIPPVYPLAPPIYTPFLPRSTGGADNPAPTAEIGGIILGLTRIARKLLRRFQ